MFKIIQSDFFSKKSKTLAQVLRLEII